MQQSSPKTFGWKWPVFLIIIAAELYTMYRFWQNNNGLLLLGLIFGSIALGIILMRWEGSICWKRILYMERHNMSSTEEMRDGVLILFAGILMIIPGLVTDVIGLLLFLPPIRWIVRKVCLRNLYFEIPEGLDSQFHIFTFSNHSQQGERNNSSEQTQSEGFEEDYCQSSVNDPNVQIIDVKATDPQKNLPPSENEDKNKENENINSENKDNNKSE